MRSRLVLLAVIVIATGAGTFALAHFAFAFPSRSQAAHASLPPGAASYLGVYEAGSPPA